MIIKTVRLAMVGAIDRVWTYFDKGLHSDTLVFEVDTLEALEHLEGYDFVFVCGRMASGENVICIDPDREPDCVCFDVWDSTNGLAFRIKNFVEYLNCRYGLQYTRHALETTIDTSEDLIWHKSVDGIHLKVNRAFCEAVDKERKDVEGRDHYDVWNVPRPEKGKDELICVTSEDTVIEKRAYCIFDEDVKIRNTVHKFVTGKSPLFNLDGDVVATVGVGKDVTSEEQHKHALMLLAMTDALTGAYNRNYVTEQVVPGNHIYNVAFFDINFFKEINDHLGHEKGDEILSLVAGALSKYMSSDIAARWGGDEFLVIRTTAPTQQDDFKNEVMDILKRMNEAIKDIDDGLGCSVSVGTASNRGDEDFDTLIKRADERMYVMKEMIHSAKQVS